MIYAILVAILGLILALSCSVWGSIGFVLVIIIVGAVQVRVFPVIPSFAADVIRWLKRRGRRPIQLFFLVIFVGVLLVVAFFSELSGFAGYYASSLHWNSIFHVVVIVLYWHLVLVFGQVAYQAISFLFARHYFHVAQGFGVLGRLLKRTFLHSIGISAFQSLVLAITAPVYFLAKLSVTDVVNALQPISAPIAHAVSRVLYHLHFGSVKLAGVLDGVFKWPSQRGMVYCAVFGISVPQGCRRVAEIDSRFGMNSISAAWHVNSLIGVGGLCLETVGGVLGWAFASNFVRGKGDKTQHIHIERVAGAFGFFFSFAIIHVLRMLVAGLVDTLFICFSEDPETLRQEDPVFAAKLEEQYKQEAPLVASPIYEP